MKKKEIAVGGKFRFLPCYHSNYGHNDFKDNRKVTGTIVYVNHPHRYFRVEFPAGKRGKMLSECFKF